MPCGRILPAGGFIRYPRVRIRMEKSIAVSVYGGFSRDRLPETGRNHTPLEPIPVCWGEISQRYRFNSGNHSGRPFRYSISFQKFCGPVFHSYMPGRSGPDEKFPHAGKKAPACGLPVLPDILCSSSDVMSDRKPCSGR